MDAKNPHDFWTRVQNDPQFRDRLMAAATDQELAVILKSEGFTVTADELQAGLDAWKQQATEGLELSDAQMEAVAGGMFANTQLTIVQNGISQVTPTRHKG
jgi:predicted ribosomally synthesized peptide with nif11-like leader